MIRRSVKLVIYDNIKADDRYYRLNLRSIHCEKARETKVNKYRTDSLFNRSEYRLF